MLSICGLPLLPVSWFSNRDLSRLPWGTYNAGIAPSFYIHMCILYILSATESWYFTFCQCHIVMSINLRWVKQLKLSWSCNSPYFNPVRPTAISIHFLIVCVVTAPQPGPVSHTVCFFMRLSGLSPVWSQGATKLTEEHLASVSMLLKHACPDASVQLTRLSVMPCCFFS